MGSHAQLKTGGLALASWLVGLGLQLMHVPSWAGLIFFAIGAGLFIWLGLWSVHSWLAAREPQEPPVIPRLGQTPAPGPETQLAAAQAVGDMKREVVAEHEAVLVASQREVAAKRVKTMIDRGAAIRLAVVPMERYSDLKDEALTASRDEILTFAKWNESQSFAAETWHKSVIRELTGIGGGAIGLYTSDESATASWGRDVGSFLDSRLAELQEILLRLIGQKA